MQGVAGILPVCGEFAVHQVDGASSLVGGQPNALPERKQENIAMPSEHRSEYLSLPLVRPKPFQFFSGAAAAVVEQDRGKRTAALKAPEQRVQGDRPGCALQRFQVQQWTGPWPSSRVRP